MEEKKTIFDIIKENKGKIVKVGLIVVGIGVGALVVLKLKNGQIIETIENINPDGVANVISSAVEAAA